MKYSTPIVGGSSVAVLERPAALTITGADPDCDTCFGRGEIYAKPGIFKPCPTCSGGFTAAASALVDVAPLMGVGCLDCMHDCGGAGCGCGCGCCPYPHPLPAVAVTTRGEV